MTQVYIDLCRPHFHFYLCFSRSSLPLVQTPRNQHSHVVLLIYPAHAWKAALFARPWQTFSSIPRPFSVWNDNMAVSQVRGIPCPDEESPEAGTSRSRPRRYKATNMSLEEMLEMVDILRRKDYDGDHGPYNTPNRRKAKIMDKVARRL